MTGNSVNIGNLSYDEGKVQKAVEWYTKAVPLLEVNLNQDRRRTEDRLFLRNAHWGRARSLTNLEHDAEAVKDGSAY